MSLAIVFDQVFKRFSLPHERQFPRQSSWLNRFVRRGEWKEWFWALHDVSFEIPRGETLGLIGANGSGKSTILKLIARILYPTTGAIAAHGRTVALLELGAGFHPELSGRDNVYLNASLHGVDRREVSRVFDAIVAFAELERFIDTPVKFYSSGMHARLAFAVGAHFQPDILLVDETLAVGDQAFQAKCIERIREIKAQGTTIVVVSHDLDILASLCDHALWLERGRVQQIGGTRAVVASYLCRVAQ